MGFLNSCWETFLQITTYAHSLGLTGDQQPLHLPNHEHNDYAYSIEIDLQAIAPDGYLKPLGQVINGSYPGPELEVCWGDQLVVHVTNKIPNLGTTIHWHGIRQFGTNDMDGVNGVTQCPIAAGREYTYNMSVEQYGHTWYHSHYQTQYSDGLAGPLTIYGPSSANFDEAFTPLFMQDWVHGNTSDAFKEELTGGIPVADSLLLGGLNKFKCSNQDLLCCNSCSNTTNECKINAEFCCQPDPRCTANITLPNGLNTTAKQVGGTYSQTFQTGKRYLFKLINTSAEAMFIFMIDGHDLLVIEADLVPIRPYLTDSIFIGIGQRYQVIVTAAPKALSPDCIKQNINCNYWIRTRVAVGCGTVGQDDETTGIIQYNASRPARTVPTTTPNTLRSACVDEPVASLRPVFHWDVDDLVNSRDNYTFDATLDNTTAFKGAYRWDLLDYPLFLNYSDPTILNTNNATYLHQNYSAIVNYSNPEWNDKFVYLVITGNKLDTKKQQIPAAHPIHLHGHDFVILAQEDSAWDGKTIPEMQHWNPPRRDVALLYSGGYLALGFKLDNPGVWLVHCHIAWHASSGLALQILERQQDIKPTLGSLTHVDQVCDGWDQMNLKFAQDDSGI
ncbi:hypothetical protein LTR85_002243 [Meristemomyces frigidus]|nr:hypothetical protein LTR85_002243 [Meristemomyces frigidus]